MGTWFVANDYGHIAGHDMNKESAELLAAYMNENHPGEGWQALDGKDKEVQLENLNIIGFRVQYSQNTTNWC